MEVTQIKKHSQNGSEYFVQHAIIGNKGMRLMYSIFIKERLIEERKSAGYSQQQLADLTGIRNSLIAKIEVGSRKPDVETVGKLAEFYGISTDWLFGLGQKNSSNIKQ